MKKEIKTDTTYEGDDFCISQSSSYAYMYIRRKTMVGSPSYLPVKKEEISGLITLLEELKAELK